MTTKPPSEADIFRNKTAVKQAERQRVIQSWLTPPPTTNNSDAAVADTTQTAYNDEAEFEGFMDELGGVGSKRKADDDDDNHDILGSLKRKKVAGTDKLLERLIGRKGAEAKRKEASHVASKPRAGVSKAVKAKEESEDEEEGGRAGAFRSKRQGAVPAVVRDVSAEPEDEDGVEDDETREVTAQSTAKAAAPPPPTKPNKPKPTSYLDELLTQRASKKKKKKKSKSKETSIEI